VSQRLIKNRASARYTRLSTSIFSRPWFIEQPDKPVHRHFIRLNYCEPRSMLNDYTFTSAGPSSTKSKSTSTTCRSRSPCSSAHQGTQVAPEVKLPPTKRWSVPSMKSRCWRSWLRSQRQMLIVPSSRPCFCSSESRHGRVKKKVSTNLEAFSFT